MGKSNDTANDFTSSKPDTVTQYFLNIVILISSYIKNRVLAVFIPQSAEVLLKLLPYGLYGIQQPSATFF
ncbi:hypothetical protein D3C81_2075310 [compost metagenome]